MGYVALEDLKMFLGIEGNDKDGVLQWIIDKTSSLIDSYLWYSLFLKEYTEFYPSRESSVIFVERKPIIEIKYVKNGKWELFEVKRFWENAIHLKRKIKGEAEIKYTAGYKSEEIPLEIKNLCLDMWKQTWGEYNSDGELDIKQKKIDTLSITYFSKEESIQWNDSRTRSSFENILEPYKVFIPLAI
jgi:hypothetical protein